MIKIPTSMINKNTIISFSYKEICFFTEVFDHKDQPLFPVQEAILWSIFHTGDTKSTSEMKVFLVRSQLEERHGYSRTTFDAKLLVDKYINQLPAMSKNPEYLLSVKQVTFFKNSVKKDTLLK